MDDTYIRATRVPPEGNCPGFTARIWSHDGPGKRFYITIDVDTLIHVHRLGGHDTIADAMANFDELVRRAPAMLAAWSC